MGLRGMREDDVLGARSTGIENFDGIKVDFLGNTVENGANCAGHMSAMTVAIGVVAVDGIVKPSSTAFKLLYPVKSVSWPLEIL